MSTEEVKDSANESVNDAEDNNQIEEDYEPILKYDRIGNSIPEILHKEAASCMAVHSKFLALGTHFGVVHILDHQGNKIQIFSSHTTTVNQIAIDDNGDFVSSCSEEGKVVINGLYTTENNIQHMFDCPIRSIGLHPDFGRRGNKQYVIGVGEKLTLYEIGWLRNKSTILHSGEGFVRSIKWKNNFIAWANAEGVEVYDTNAKERITHISRDVACARDELFNCNLCWKDDVSLFVAWGNSIKVCIVKQRPANDVRGLPRHFVEIAHVFSLEFFISGIAPFGNEMVVLAYSFDEEDGVAPTKGNAQRPQFLVIKPEGMYKYDEASNDSLTVRGFEMYKCNNYFLEHVVEEKLFYIVSPKDIVIARPRDLDDHINWLIEKQKFKEALDEAEKKQRELKQNSVLNIGKAYLSFLHENDKFEEAALLCDRILGKNKGLWEEEVYKFVEKKKLKIITPYIPRTNPQLGNALYELVLNEYLQTDCEGFYKLLTDWPVNLYNSQAIISTLQNKIRESPNESLLLQSLATLYLHVKKFGEALRIYLTLGHQGVFEMIAKHNLLLWVKDKCLQLMEIEPNRALSMFIENIEQFPVDSVVKQLSKNEKLLHQYLHALFVKDPHAGHDYHHLQVKLYAEFQRDRLQPFLRNSNYYQLEQALKVCEERDYIPEMVFLHGRMGNNKKALSLIIDKMHNIQKAIDFAKEENDEDLWDDLIAQSLLKPAFIKELLINIGTHVDPKKLIMKIQPGMEIPGLRDALVKILHDYNLQVSLHEGCKTILDKDSVALYDKQVKSLTKGFAIFDVDNCSTCQGKLIVEDNRRASTIVTFFCKHTYHEACLQQLRQSEPFCPMCASRKSTARKKNV